MKMLEIRNNYRAVDWFGFTLYIQHSHTAVAADSDGEVYSFEDTPIAEDTFFGVCWSTDMPNYDHVCTVDLTGIDCRATLVEYPL